MATNALLRSTLIFHKFQPISQLSQKFAASCTYFLAYFFFSLLPLVDEKFLSITIHSSV
jgi:hypothetical protein